MKKKLEETGKRCSYKNFDLFPTKVIILLQVVITYYSKRFNLIFSHCQRNIDFKLTDLFIF